MRTEQEANIEEALDDLNEFLEMESDGLEATVLTPEQRVKLFEAVGVLQQLKDTFCY